MTTLSSRPLLLFALALLLAAGLGAWQGRAARDEAPAAATPGGGVVEAAPEAAPALPEAFTDAPPVPELPGLPPLPPASMRLGEAWPALEARALAGDWRAGCRLAAFADGTLAGRHLLFDDEGRRLHREHGPWAIERLIALGEGHGLYLLMVGNGDVRFTPLNSVVPEDPDLGVAAGEAIRALRGSPERSVRYERLDAAARARVDLQIEALRQRFGRERPAWRGEGPFAPMLSISSHNLPPEQIEAYCRVAIAQRTP